MNKLLYFIFFFLACCEINAQKHAAKIDSLKTVLPITKNETQKGEVLFALGETYWFMRKIQEAREYLRQSILSSEATKDVTNYCNAQLLLGFVYMKMGVFDSALLYLNGCLQCSQVNNQPEHVPKAYDGLSLFHNLLGDDEKAIEYGLKSATLFEQSPLAKIKRQSLYPWISIGNILKRQGQYKKANGYFMKALRHGEAEKDKNMIVPAMISLAGNHYAASDYTAAKDYYGRSYSILTRLEPLESLVHAIEGLGNIAMIEKNYPKAISFFYEGIAVCRDNHFLSLLGNLYFNLGKAYLQSNRLDSAQFFVAKSLVQAQKDGHLGLQKQIYSQLANLAVKKGGKDSAIAYLLLEKKLADTIFSIEKQKAVSKLEILYQTEKSQKDILALGEENNQKGTTITKRDKVIVVISVLSISILFVAILAYRNVQEKKMLAVKETKIKEEELAFLKGQQQVMLLQSMVGGQEAERTRIARDLHDVLGGLFSTVKMYFSTLQHEQASLRDNELFAKSYDLVDTASDEIRRVAHNMMPEVLMKLGLIPALQDMCANISAGKSVKINLQSYGMNGRLNVSTEIMLYRIVQELLTNVVKHAHATEAIVQFNRDNERLTVTVEDNGTGFTPNETEDKKHSGLQTIRSRVTYLNGTFTIDSRKAVGTTTTMEFLLHPEPDESEAQS